MGNLSDHRDLLTFKIFPHRGVLTGIQEIDHLGMDISFLIAPQRRILIVLPFFIGCSGNHLLESPL